MASRSDSDGETTTTSRSSPPSWRRPTALPRIKLSPSAMQIHRILFTHTHVYRKSKGTLHLRTPSAAAGISPWLPPSPDDGRPRPPRSSSLSGCHFCKQAVPDVSKHTGRRKAVLRRVFVSRTQEGRGLGYAVTTHQGLPAVGGADVCNGGARGIGPALERRKRPACRRLPVAGRDTRTPRRDAHRVPSAASAAGRDACTPRTAVSGATPVHAKSSRCAHRPAVDAGRLNDVHIQ